MSTYWTIIHSGTEKSFAAWGFAETATRTRSNMAADTLTLSAPGAVDGSPVFAYGDAVTVYRDRTYSLGSYSGGTIWFQGKVASFRRAGNGKAQRIDYRIVGPWWDLERLVFQQQWQITTDGTTYTGYPCSDVYLGLSPTNTPYTAGQQINEALTYAITCGINLQIGTIDPTTPIVPYNVRDLTIAEVLVQMCRWTPDAVAFFDYTTSPPTLNIRQLSLGNLPNVAVPPDGVSLRDIALTPRYDLQLPAVIIRYKSTGVVNGVPYVTITTDVAPGTATGHEVGAAVFTVDLYGIQRTDVRANLNCVACNAQSTTPSLRNAWWKLHDPLLGSDKIANLSISSAVVVDDTLTAINLATYPNELIDGQVASWMNMAGTPISTVKAQVKSLATYDLYADSAQKVLLQKGRTKELSTHVKLTNGITGQYWATQSYTTGETAPTGWAAAILAAHATLQYDGSFTLVGAAVPSSIGMGNSITLTFGAQTLPRLLIQSITEEPHMGRMSITVGHAKHLGITDIINILRGNRARVTFNNPSQRTTGQCMDAGDVQLGAAHPSENTTGGLGAFGTSAASDDKGTTGGNPNGTTVATVDAINEAFGLVRVNPSTGAAMTADGGGNALGSVSVALSDLGGKAAKFRTMSDGSRVLATSDFKGGGGGSTGIPFLFLGFITPHGSPDGTSQVLIYGVMWNMAWSTGMSLSGIPTVFCALPQSLRSNITSELIGDLTGYGNATQVVYSAYDYTGFSVSSVQYWHQQKLATPAGGSGLPAATVYVNPPYLTNQVLLVEQVATAINVQVNSGDPVTAGSPVNGGTGTYAVNDILTVTGGTGTAASLKVSAIGNGTASAVAIVAAGAGYKVGDVLTVVGGTGTAATLTVTSISTQSGRILTASLTTGGSYTAAPSSGASTSGGTGSGCTVTLTLFLAGQVAAVTVNNAGAYSVVPTNPVSVTGGGGSSATFNLYYTLVGLADSNQQGRAWAA
jgi:hypothetical protein